CAFFVPFMGRNALLWFVDLSSVGASLAYFVTCLSALKIANTQKDKIIAMMGGGVSVLFLVVLLLPIFGTNISVPSYYCLVLWIVLGIFVYKLFNKNKGKLGVLLKK
ncbi:amino acid permease, partial [Candidatus Gracilibacteria bacterium]